MNNMSFANGNFLDENGQPVNLVKLLKTGKAVPVVDTNDGHYMSAHSGWFTDEEGNPVNIIALIDEAIDKNAAHIIGISINGSDPVSPDENGVINLTLSGGGSVVIDSSLSNLSTNPVQNKVITREFKMANEQITALKALLN